MRQISLLAFTVFALMSGVYLFKNNYASNANSNKNAQESSKTLLSKDRRQELDKIGNVINVQNVTLDNATMEKIRNEKLIYDSHQGIRDLEARLEQSFQDRNSSIEDIVKIQNEVTDKKNSLKIPIENTEQWNPKLVYYLMIQENYNYPEINLIKSLSENGIGKEELDYINEIIEQDTFTEKIMSFKGQGDLLRTLASFRNPKDDVNEDQTKAQEEVTVETKLADMNYNQEQNEESNNGNGQ